METKDQTEFDFRDPEWLGRKLKLDKNTVYKFLQDGTIPAVQLGRKWFVSEHQLLSWMNEESLRQAGVRRKAVHAVDQALRKMTHLSRASRIVFRNAFAEARRLSVRHLGTEHLLIALAEASSTRAAKALAACDISSVAMRKLLEAQSSSAPGSADFRPRRRLHARQAMRIARQLATDAGSDLVEPEHLLAGILQTPFSKGAKTLALLGCNIPRLKKLLDSAKRASTKGNS